MAKNVFEAADIAFNDQPVVIEIPKREEEEPKYLFDDMMEEKPAKEDMRHRVEIMRRDFENELHEREKQFEKSLEDMRKESEEYAFDKVKEASEEYEQRIQEGIYDAQKLVEQAKEEATNIVNDAQTKAASMEGDADITGYEKGKEEGFQNGKEEVERVISRLNNILSGVVKKRNTIIMEAHIYIFQLIILETRKIIKKITEESERVVLDNIFEVLKNLKGRQEVTLRVNTSDLPVVAYHKKEFLQLAEGIERLNIIEDNSVDRGGCIVNTDFGTIDARISVQLNDLEKEIETILKKNPI